MVYLISSIDNRINPSSPNYQEYLAARECFYDNFIRGDRGNMDLLWHLYNIVKRINETENGPVNLADYNSMVSFDYVDVIRDNVYNGIFNRPNYIVALSDLDLRNFFTEDMQLLQIVNPSLYSDILNHYFSKSEFDDIKLVNATLHAEIMALYSGRTEFDAWLAGIKRLHKNPEYNAILCNKYMEIHNSLSSYRTAVIKERDIIFYQIRMGLDASKKLLKSYKLLSDSDKVLVNKYLYDQSYELIKTFNGLYYMQGIYDFTENLTMLWNIHNVSDDYFLSLIGIYSALVCSRNINALFKKNITDLNAGQISDILLNEMPQYYLTTFGCFFGEDHGCHRNLMLKNLVKYVHWGNTNAVDNLTEVYNWFVYYSGQYE
ncbi:hypothetical protein [uncultured Methanobrevibacter sp.]|uniref:hypothetical protein n=1 Tax=uncultured Methanobrevibacter sp. TaxID=253161 RepID=UPI0025FCE951|nr:hypothetical protein [uncultured Methanobrevibacter sp.]